jgi:PAS domain S-box-containing protein
MAAPSRKTKQQLIEEIEALRKQLDTREKPRREEPAESRQLYETLAHSSHAGVYVILDGRFEFLNEKAAVLAGYPIEEMLGRKCFDIVHPEDREAIRERAREMLKGRRSAPYEYRIIAKDGRIRWIMETVTPIQYKGRRAILGNSMDITAQKEHSRRLQELEALEASILDAIPHAVLGLAKRRVIFANDAVDAVFGWRPEELSGKTTRILYRSDEEYNDIGKFVYSTLRRQRTCSAEIPCRRMDGREIVVRLHASRIGDDLKEGRIIAVYEDITKRKRSEKALRESERFNKEIISSAHEGVIVYDREGRYIVWNRFMEDLTGLPAEEVLGANAFEVFPHLREQGVDILLDGPRWGHDRGAGSHLLCTPERKDGMDFRHLRAIPQLPRGDRRRHRHGPRYHRAQARRGGPAEERGKLPRHLRDGPGLHLHQGPRSQVCAGEPQRGGPLRQARRGDRWAFRRRAVRGGRRAADPRDGLPHPRRRDG